MISRFLLILAVASVTLPWALTEAGETSSRFLQNDLPTVAIHQDGNLSIPPIEKYSVSFQSCKVFQDSDGSRSKNGQFVIFRLCPAVIDYYESKSCSDDAFGEYVVPLEDYLSAVVPHQQKAQDEMCRECKEMCKRAPEGPKCSSCYDTCSWIEEMNDNGYIDATEFSRCQLIHERTPDDDSNSLYAGPLCVGEGGSAIRIGVFGDSHCTLPAYSKEVDDYLHDENGYGLKLSYALLRSVYENDGISCRDPNTLGNSEVCELLYRESGRCETPHGFPPAKNHVATDEEQQGEQELCRFIETLQNGPTPNKTKPFVLVGAIVISLGLAGVARALWSKQVKLRQPTSGDMEFGRRAGYELISMEGMMINT